MNAVSSKLAAAVTTTASLFRTVKRAESPIPGLGRVALTGWILGFVLAILIQLFSVSPDEPRAKITSATTAPTLASAIAAR